jgi:hypothetical protein
MSANVVSACQRPHYKKIEKKSCSGYPLRNTRWTYSRLCAHDGASVGKMVVPAARKR